MTHLEPKNWIWRWATSVGRRQIAIIAALGLLALLAFHGRATGQERESAAAKPRGQGSYHETAKFSEHTGAVQVVALSPDGRYLASAGDDQTIHLIDGKTWKSNRKRLAANPVRALSFLRNGDLMVAGVKDAKLRQSVYVWQWKNDRIIGVWPGADSGAIAIAPSPDGTKLGIVEAEGGMTSLGMRDGVGVAFEGNNLKYKRTTVAWSPNSKSILTGGTDGRIRIWQFLEGRNVKGAVRALEFPDRALVNTAVFSPSGKGIATAHADGSVRLWNEANGKLLTRNVGHEGGARSAAYTPDGKYVISGGDDKTIKVWDANNGELMWVVGGHTDKVNCVLAPTNDTIVSASADGTVRYWRRGDAGAGAGDATAAIDKPRIARKRPTKKDELAVPDSKAVAKALALLKDVFKEDWDKATDVAGQRGLATKLLEQGRQTENAAAERYAALDAARQLAIDAGHIEGAVEIADEIGAWFKTDHVALLADTMDKISKNCRTTDARTKLANTALALVDDATDADRYDDAARLVKVADAAAKNLRKPDLIKTVRSVDNQVAAAKAQWDAYRAARKQLMAESTDPAANLAVGKFLCFTRGQWSKGMPYLARGGDAKIKAAATKELAEPTTGDEWEALGDLWQAAAEANSGETQSGCAGAADYWYRKALAELTGLRKLKVQKSLEKVGPIPSHLQRRDAE